MKEELNKMTDKQEKIISDLEAMKVLHNQLIWAIKGEVNYLKIPETFELMSNWYSKLKKEYEEQ